MPTKRQTRRSVSLRGLTYQRLRNLAKAMVEEGLLDEPSQSGCLEVLISIECGKRGIPEETELERIYRKTRDNKSAASGIFTF